jgi:8-oxo-dGTP diphosphatase
MTVIKSVATIILDDDNNIILVNRKGEPFSGYWCLPGGKLEPNEDEWSASIREAKEETGLEIKNLYYIGRFTEVSSYKGNPCVYEANAIVATIIGGKLQAQESEVNAVDRFNFSDIPTLAFRHNEMINLFLNNYYGLTHCPKCGSKKLEAITQINGWDEINTLKFVNYVKCNNCNVKFTRGTRVSVN